jgi:hypothetical protein
MSKQEKIDKIQEMLICKKGYPQLKYLNKLTDSELFNLMFAIGFHKDFAESMLNEKEKKE